MRPWIPRLLWLAAWSFWLWLGFGLHRELPREMVFVRELPLGRNGKYLGFVGDSHHIVALSTGRPDGPTTITVFNAETGDAVRHAEGPPQTSVWLDSAAAVKQGVLFANRNGEHRSRGSFHVLDLETGKWRRLTENSGSDATVHPHRPWVVFNEFSKTRIGKCRVVAMDFNTGREVFSRELRPDAPVYRNPYFFNDDRILIQITEGSVDSPPAAPKNNEKTSALSDVNSPRLKHRLEIWRGSEPPELEQRLDNVILRFVATVASDGRVAYSGAPMEPAHGVFDFALARTVFNHPIQDPQYDGRFHQGGGPHPRLSASGRAVFGGTPRTLREVDTNLLLWGPPTPQFMATPVSQDYFAVLETWHQYWIDWFPNFIYQTRALRSMETGELIFRSAGTQTWNIPVLFSADRSLGVGFYGNVHRMPPPINYPLLALCQSILALPLILLWTILRWRRNRRLRMSSMLP